jgi:hypothetical protein
VQTWGWWWWRTPDKYQFWMLVVEVYFALCEEC